MVSTEFEFSAFVSYRHLDAAEPGRQWAAWVQNVLERYTTPPELAGQESLYHDAVPAAMPRVFRDKDQIPAHGDLGALIHDALERSRVLIVLCTPAAVDSPWVADEILHFKKLGRADRIIAIVLRGKPYALDPAEECFPVPLRYKLLADGTLDRSQEEKPIYIDLRPPLGSHGATSAEEYRTVLQQADEWKDTRIEQAVVKYLQQLEDARILLLSGVLGLAPRDLTQRDLLRQIEEEKQRAAEAAQRAAWEAEQKRIAETARAEAETARAEAETARNEAVAARTEAETALAAAETARGQADQARQAAERDRRVAEEARADEQRQRRQAQRSRGAAILLALLACAVAIWAYTMRHAAERDRNIAQSAQQDAIAQKGIADNERGRAETEKNAAVASQEKAVKARRDADLLINDLLYNLVGELGAADRLVLMKSINERVGAYYAQHPPDVTDPPSVTDNYERERGVMFNQRGDIAREARDWILARQSYRQALEIRQRLVDKDATNTDWQRCLTITLDGFGILEALETHREAALASFTKAHEIRQRLSSQHPTESLYAIDLACMKERLARLILQGVEPDRKEAETLIIDGLKLIGSVDSKEQTSPYFKGVSASLDALKLEFEKTR